MYKKYEICSFLTPTRDSQSVWNLTSIEIAGTSVPLANQVKLLYVTFNSCLNFDKHISKVCSSLYFHSSALHHIRPFHILWFRNVVCVIVGPRLAYANSILIGISIHNIHCLQLVQISLERVITRSTTNIISALNSLHCLPIRSRLIINWLQLSTVHSTTSALNTCHLYYNRMLHCLSFAPSLNILLQPCFYIALASSGLQHDCPALWKSLPHNLRPTNSYTVFKSNLKTRLFSGASISGPNSSIHALLIPHNSSWFLCWSYIKLYLHSENAVKISTCRLHERII